VAPERLLAAEAVLEAPNLDPVVLEVDVLEGEHRHLVHAQDVM